MPSDLNLGIIFAAVRLKNEFTPEMQKVVAAAQKAGQEMQAAGRVLTLGITAPLVGASIAALKTSIDFESSFAGVRKTVTATEPELQALADGFRDLALEIPTNVNELNKIGEAAGQLGIQTPNILGFTETMAALGVTTNLSSEAAATSLARLANITGLQQDKFDNLGSAIVGLGNNFATTESEIVDFGLRIAGAGELAGLSEGEILGIGTAMSSIGVQAEAGGTAVQKVLNEINQSVATGDEELRVFAEVAGMTAEQFSAAFRDDAAGAFESFVTGLGTQGDKSFTVMEDLGFESERVIRAFLGLANAGDLLSKAMDEGNKSFEENVALMIEAEQRYGTTESRLALLWARVRELGITLGDSLIPAVHSFIDIAGPMLTFVTDSVKWWSKWPGPLKVASLAVLALVAAVGPALLIGGTILTSWATLTLAFPVLGAALAAAGLKATAFWVSLSGPIGWSIAAFAAVAAAVYHFREELGLVKPSIEDMGLEAARQHVEDLEERVDSLSGQALGRAHAALVKARDGLAELEKAAADAAGAVEKLTKDNFPAFAVTLQDAEAQLAQAKDGLNQMAAAGMVVDQEMEYWVEGLERHVEALKNTESGIEATAEAAAKFSKTIEGQSAALGHWGLDISNIGRQVDLIPPFISTLSGTIEDQSAALGHWGLDISNIGIQLDPLPLKLDEFADAADSSTETNQKFALSLALIAGQVGGPYGQALNQMSAMLKAVDEDGKRTFTNTEAAVAGFGAALAVAGSEMGGYGGIAVETLGNVASALAKGDWIGAAIAGLTGLGKALDRAFNGAQMAFNDLTNAITGSLDAIASGALTAAEAFDKATNWTGNEEGYERLRKTQQLWVEAGLSAEEATVWAERFAEANRNQDEEALRALLEEYEGIAVAADEAAEAAERLAAASNAAVEAFRSAQAAGETAYDETLQAAIESGLGQEAAVAQATAAQLAASAEVLVAKGIEYARIAAFDAAMALDANATAAERAEAARGAAKAAIESWDAAMVAVVASDKAANEALDGTWNPETGDVVTNVAGTLDQIAESAEVSSEDIIAASTAARDEEILQLERLLKAAVEDFEAMTTSSEDEAANVNAALAGIDDVEVNLNYHYSTSGDPGPGAQGGGYDGGYPDEEYSFARGSGGRFIDFGRESTIKVHGKERIVTESEGRREAENNTASLQGVEDRLDRLDANLQRAIKRISTDVTNVVMTKSL